LRYVLQRLLQFAIVFFIVTFGVMVLIRLGLNAPGDPARTLLGGSVTDEMIAEYTQKYLYWFGNFITGDMGFSKPNSMDVSKLVLSRVMVTVLLGIYALVLALVISVPLAVRQAWKRDGRFDKSASIVTFGFVSVPGIVLAPLLVLVFVKKTEFTFGNYVLTIGGWFPRIGDKIYPWQDLGAHFHNFFVPVLVLALPLAAIYTRILRGDMVQTLQADFITLASAKGVPPRRVLWVHALRNSLLSLLTAVGGQIGGIVGGALIVESYFAMPGMGNLLVAAILSRDFFIVQSVAAILVITVVLTNLVVDLLYAVLDPRIRHARALA
jgi:peptide/nickel transport system permease protein